MSAPESPSALLHRAASLLGKRAQAAGGGTWNYRDSWVWDGLFEIADVHGGPDMDAIGEYIASMGPAAGLAVADWLAERASDAEDAYQVNGGWRFAQCDSPAGITAALKVARAVLGEPDPEGAQS